MLYTAFQCTKQLSKLPLSVWGLGPPANTWFSWLTRVHNSNGTSIGSAVFAVAQPMIVTDRPTAKQTDRPSYSVSNNRPHTRMYIHWIRHFKCIAYCKPVEY